MEKNKSYKHEVNIKIEGEEWKKALHKAYHNQLKNEDLSNRDRMIFIMNKK